MFSIKIIKKLSSNESKVSYNGKCIRHCSQRSRVSYKAELTAASQCKRICRGATVHLRQPASRGFGHCALPKGDIHQPSSTDPTDCSEQSHSKTSSTQIVTQSQPALITCTSLSPVLGNLELWSSTHWLRSFLWVSLQTA